MRGVVNGDCIFVLDPGTTPDGSQGDSPRRGGRGEGRLAGGDVKPDAGLAPGGEIHGAPVSKRVGRERVDLDQHVADDCSVDGESRWDGRRDDRVGGVGHDAGSHHIRGRSWSQTDANRAVVLGHLLDDGPWLAEGGGDGFVVWVDGALIRVVSSLCVGKDVHVAQPGVKIEGVIGQGRCGRWCERGREDLGELAADRGEMGGGGWIGRCEEEFEEVDDVGDGVSQDVDRGRELWEGSGWRGGGAWRRRGGEVGGCQPDEVEGRGGGGGREVGLSLEEDEGEGAFVGASPSACRDRVGVESPGTRGGFEGKVGWVEEGDLFLA